MFETSILLGWQLTVRQILGSSERLNHAAAEVVVWSVRSLVAFLGGSGYLLPVFGHSNFLGWHPCA
jgi:hypothetical protein